MNRVKIKISYVEINEDDLDYSIMLIISPIENIEKKVYFHELYLFKEIRDIIKQREIDNFTYDIINNDFSPYFIDISLKEYENLRQYLKGETVYEKVYWSNQKNMLDVILNIYRKDPKSWEV